MFDLDIKVSSNEYFDLIRKLECLTSENEHLKHLNENQMNMIIDLRNEITDLKKQNGDLCELVGKTKKESKDYEAMQNELRSLQDENAARIEAYEKLDKRYKDLVHERMKDLRAGAKDLQDLKDSIKQLRDECSKKEEDIQYWKAKSNDYWNRRQFWKDKYDVLMTAYKTETADLKKKLKSVCETCDVPDNCVNASEAVLKDADAKIQSANNKAANAKKEAKQAKETAERYREENFVLHRQIDQFKKLNDELIKELARKGED